jgi:plasmid stabilization system protein ParE
VTATYHRLAVRDVREILDHYESEGGPALADRFFDDLLGGIAKAVENPRRFHPIDERFRRANLADFPYHFLYEERDWGIKVLVVRHHHRDPSYGTRRQ